MVIITYWRWMDLPPSVYRYLLNHPLLDKPRLTHLDYDLDTLYTQLPIDVSGSLNQLGECVLQRLDQGDPWVERWFQQLNRDQGIFKTPVLWFERNTITYRLHTHPWYVGYLCLGLQDSILEVHHEETFT